MGRRAANLGKEGVSRLRGRSPEDPPNGRMKTLKDTASNHEQWWSHDHFRSNQND